MPNYLDTAVTAAVRRPALARETSGRRLTSTSSTRTTSSSSWMCERRNLITQILLDELSRPRDLRRGRDGGQRSQRVQWIVDPLDGTVNYFYGIPHFCVSIALRQKEEILVGVIYDPSRDELFTSSRGAVSTLNGKPIAVSQRPLLGDAIISVGLAKVTETIHQNLPVLQELIHRVRKCRHDGQRGIGPCVCLVRPARRVHRGGGISLWDVAAGILLVRNAGGRVTMHPRPTSRRSIQSWQAAG